MAYNILHQLESIRGPYNSKVPNCQDEAFRKVLQGQQMLSCLAFPTPNHSWQSESETWDVAWRILHKAYKNKTSQYL